VTALHDPERKNVDLQDTSIETELPRKTEMIADVNNGSVTRVLATQEETITRVVLELKKPMDYNAVMSAESPYWHMIALHPPTAKHYSSPSYTLSLRSSEDRLLVIPRWTVSVFRKRE
jgi:hypothetical protein